ERASGWLQAGRSPQHNDCEDGNHGGRDPQNPGTGAAAGPGRRIFGAQAAHLRPHLLRCSLTNVQCARCAARRFARIWTTWIAESLAARPRRSSSARYATFNGAPPYRAATRSMYATHISATAALSIWITFSALLSPLCERLKLPV